MRDKWRATGKNCYGKSYNNKERGESKQTNCGRNPLQQIHTKPKIAVDVARSTLAAVFSRYLSINRDTRRK